MDTLEDLSLYFYIACGIGLSLHLLTFSLLAIFYWKIKSLSKAESNQLGRQTNMMADFCYTNPTIVPGEELSRRGFSMYSGNDNLNEDSNTKNKEISYGTYHEALSKF
ncbi:PREDICTED: uncharacterized protein LOC107070292 isoform X2 [Polistes dominula]|uniref:Uncharacterized protein LOC107070292 isoform X2 n=1 Tax=Polistes dominula TaxID=743375 RepID=A0ABM1IUE2_POLDO|nr:PREDICTED: uncharacterized protein LOC107070292 isoform X2 [Polistes dominula]